MAPGAEAQTVAVAAGAVFLGNRAVTVIPVLGIAVYLTRVMAAAHPVFRHFLPVALIAETVARLGFHRVMFPKLGRMRQAQAVAVYASLRCDRLVTTGAGQPNVLYLGPIVECPVGFVCDILLVA